MNGFIARIFIFILVSNASGAALSFSLRRLVTSEPRNGTTNLQVSPAGSPVNQSDTNPVNAGKPEEKKNMESQMTDKNNSNGTKTLPDNSKGAVKKDDPSPPAGNKNDTNVDEGKGVVVGATPQTLSNNVSCEGSLTSCMDKEMIACIEASKDGSKELFLVVLNRGESTLKVNVNLPNQLENPILVFEVPKHETRRVHTESRDVGKSSELIVSSANAKCVLPLVHPVSVENFIQQVSFYSRQVTPIYVAYTLFVLALLSGGTWACCKFRKKSRHDGNGITYQEIEMGLPESASAVNVDTVEGWEHDWDDDDWDEENAVRSPGGGHISADGLTSRSSKTGGWENDWDD